MLNSWASTAAAQGVKRIRRLEGPAWLHLASHPTRPASGNTSAAPPALWPKRTVDAAGGQPPERMIPLMVRGVIDDLQAGSPSQPLLPPGRTGSFLLARLDGGQPGWSPACWLFGLGRQWEAEHLRQRCFEHMAGAQEPGWRTEPPASGDVISRSTRAMSENVAARACWVLPFSSSPNNRPAYALTLPAMLAIDPLA